MNEGKKFETQWKKSVPNDVYYLRIKDSASSFGQDSAATRFTLQNPFDCFVFYNGNLFPMELKSTQSSSFSIQRFPSDKNKMIKLNQIKGLLEASNYNNIFSGFIFNFRESETYWLNIKNFMMFLSDSEKHSINENDIINYHGIMINKKIKRTRYEYDIRKLLDEIIGGR